MSNAVLMFRSLLIYGICLPLAVVLGYLLANLDRQALFVVLLVFGVLALPLLMKWHYPAMVLMWNTTAVVFLLKGRPNVWMVLAVASFIFSRVQYILNRRMVPMNVPSITPPMIALAAVIAFTAMLTGGIGFNAFGSEMGGGKRYMELGAALVGYFALSAQRIPVARANLYVGMFFLGGLSLAIGSLPYFIPTQLHFVFWFFPVDSWAHYTTQEGAGGAFRAFGFANAGLFAVFYLLARYGISQLLVLRHPFRLLFFVTALGLILMGGYRSFMLIALGVFVVHFYLEGLHRTPKLAVFLVGALFMAITCVTFSTKMPYSIQRALSVLSLPVSPEVEYDVHNSNEWRLRMWRQVAPQISEHLLLGKGYSIKMQDMDFAVERAFQGRSTDDSEGAKLAQDYHNGPLSVILPLGLWGVAAVIWFWVVTLRLLIANYRYGDAELRQINTLMLALFLVKVVHFLLIFGALATDLAAFCGIAGLSVALNGGMARRPALVPKPVAVRPRLARAAEAETAGATAG